MPKTIVKIFAKECEVTTHQNSKTVWIATGEYLGEWFEGKGRTGKAAVSDWYAQARQHGNDPPPAAKQE